MAGKHAPIELGAYLSIHDTAMGSLTRKGYVLPDGDGLSIERLPGGLLIDGRIRCASGVIIDVEKFVPILSGRGDGAIVQTRSYTYHAQVEDLGNLLRYCAPHDHRPYHHKHTYDALSGDAHGTVAGVDPETRPTLAEVIEEACDWCFGNAAAIIARRGW